MENPAGVRGYVVTAVDVAGRPGRSNIAIDLGCGSDVVPLYLIGRGWRVLAIDKDPTVVAHLRARAEKQRSGRLSAVCADFQEIPLPRASLIHAGYALQYAHPASFADLWRRISAALYPDGVFAGHFFGQKDQFAKYDQFSAFKSEALQILFADWRIEHWHEFHGPGHRDPSRLWHFFTVVAKLPGNPT
ncbi:class I SAM-dependent methyltransferase [Cupriavidus necator]|uniref:Class I SAM-dependent methyltransferase n=1 Tax=Cupriavidus necator TaxID=106590 RepID=A0A2P1DUW4_CUPNE|nr:class I SAM-dependent methyltransferase [Cupriavidus necator]AVK72187.1 class I SAM-dependent methyltransferase [Cupriavidus necator]